MEKTVYCLIANRCKRIKFMSETNISDVQVIRRKLQEASKIDDILRIMLQQKMISLQKPDPDRENKLCDIEDDEEIADKTEVTVLLIPMHTNENTYTSELKSELSDTSSIHTNESVVKVLYTQTLDGDDSLLNLVNVQETTHSLVSCNKSITFLLTH